MPLITRSAWLLAALVAALAVAAACSSDGGDENGDDKLVLTPVEAKYLPIVASSELVVGENRFLLGLINQEDDSQVLGADLHLRFFSFDGSEATLKSETDAQAVTITKSFTHTHEDGTVETHEAGETGVYVATAAFDAAGRWGVEVSGTVDGAEIEPVRPVFDVRAEPLTPAIGAPAPRSEQLTLADVADIADIDTSFQPIHEMHDITIAQAVTSGKPTVIAFATPAFCQSQICGPTKDIVDELYHAHAGQANFVHVEPYDVPKLRTGDCASLFECRNLVVDEWGLQTEPWVFIVDADGNVAAKFEAIVTYEELESALTAVLG